MVPTGGAAASAALPDNPPSPAASRTNAYTYESRVLIALFLACALVFFLTYQLFGPAAATAVVVLFLVFALAAHRVRISRSFPFLHLSILSLPAAGRRWFRLAAGSTAEPAGMDAAAISALPAAFGYKREHAATGWAQCAICLGLVAIGEAVRRLPTCGHLFHAGCIDQWLRAHATCPLCRAAVGATVPELPV